MIKNYDYDWRCPSCFPACREYARVNVKCTIPGVQSNYVPGTQIICVNCKRYFEKPEMLKVMLDGKEEECIVLEDGTSKNYATGQPYPYAKLSHNNREFYVVLALGVWREISKEHIMLREQVRKELKYDEYIRQKQ